MDRLVVVGSGTVVPEGDRGGSCYYVEAGGARILLDCGPGAVQSLARLSLPWDELTDLVISHFHADHIGALPGLLFSLKHGSRAARAERPLDVWGPPGTRRLFEGLADALGEYVLDPGFPVRLREVEAGEEVSLAAGPTLRVHPTPHTEESRAIRLSSDARALGYTGDTGPSRPLGSFMAGVSVLVCECSLLDDEVGDNHLSPSRVAEIARLARPERLIVTHVYPHVRASYDVPTLIRAAGYVGGEIEMARDGLEVPLG